jgi:hypothetical protein
LKGSKLAWGRAILYVAHDSLMPRIEVGEIDVIGASGNKTSIFVRNTSLNTSLIFEKSDKLDGII